MLVTIGLYSLALLAYVYLGYPLLVYLVAALLPNQRTSQVAGIQLPAPQSVSIVIAVRNAERQILEKLRNTAEICQNATALRTQIIVASDASDDRTDDLVRDQPGVLLSRIETRGGKESAQQAALEVATGDVVLFTDVRTKLEPGVLQNLVEYFRDPKIGAVSSVDIIEGGKLSGEALYVVYEMALRAAESRLHSLVGLSGSCFAVRRSLTAGIRNDIPSDFALMMHCRKQGFRGVSAPDVRCAYGVVSSEGQEFQRKLRTVLRGMRALFTFPEMLNPFRYGVFALQLASHKLGRWLVPFFLIGAIAGLFPLARVHWIYALLLTGGLLLPALALLGYFAPQQRSKIWVKLPTFFVLSNLAILTAWFYLLTGHKMVTWTPTQT